MSETQRNFIIIILISLAIVALGQNAFGEFVNISNLALWLLNIAFLALISYGLWVFYKRNKDTIDMLPSAARTQLQVSGVVGYLVLITGLFFPGWAGQGSAMALLFFLMLGAAGFGVWNAWQKRPFRW